MDTYTRATPPDRRVFVRRAIQIVNGQSSFSRSNAMIWSTMSLSKKKKRSVREIIFDDSSDEEEEELPPKDIEVISIKSSDPSDNEEENLSFPSSSDGDDEEVDTLMGSFPEETQRSDFSQSPGLGTQPSVEERSSKKKTPKPSTASSKKATKRRAKSPKDDSPLASNDEVTKAARGLKLTKATTTAGQKKNGGDKKKRASSTDKTRASESPKTTTTKRQSPVRTKKQPVSDGNAKAGAKIKTGNSKTTAPDDEDDAPTQNSAATAKQTNKRRASPSSAEKGAKKSRAEKKKQSSSEPGSAVMEIEIPLKEKPINKKKKATKKKEEEKDSKKEEEKDTSSDPVESVRSDTTEPPPKKSARVNKNDSATKEGVSAGNHESTTGMIKSVQSDVDTKKKPSAKSKKSPKAKETKKSKEGQACADESKPDGKPMAAKGKSENGNEADKQQLPKKKKKIRFQDQVFNHMLSACKPFMLKNLVVELKMTDTALEFVMLSLIDKGLVVKKDFESKKGRVKTLYWANPDGKAKEVSVSQPASKGEMDAAKKEMMDLRAQEASLKNELTNVLETPSNDELTEKLAAEEASLEELRKKLQETKDRIQSSSAQREEEPTSLAAAATAKPNTGLLAFRGAPPPKSAVAPLERERCPRRMKMRINCMRSEWKTRKEKCMDFVVQLADGLEKKPKDIFKMLDLETDEMMGATLPEKHVIP
jgi:predicted transcriptional regulator